MNATMKVCKLCGERKSLALFSPHAKCALGVRPECRACRVEQERKRDKGHRPTHTYAYRRDHQLRSRFGITREQYDDLLAAQGNRCALCDGDKPNGQGTWHVDHDHQTGAIRGLICNSCNRGLGWLGDTINALERAVDYLRRAEGQGSAIGLVPPPGTVPCPYCDRHFRSGGLQTHLGWHHPEELRGVGN